MSQNTNAIDTQVGGDHYKKLGQYQPWEVLLRWMTAEEFRGFMKGTAVTYLAREQSKGGREDIRKAMHTLQGYLELTEETETKQEEGKYERKLEKFTGGKFADSNYYAERMQQLYNQRREPGSTYIKSDD